MKYKKGDVLVYEDGEYKVLAVIDDVCILSGRDNFDKSGELFTEKEIEEARFTLKKEKTPKDWTPEIGDNYCAIWEGLKVCHSIWNCDIVDFDHKNGLGIYKTREEAEEVVEKIKQFMGSL